MTRFLRQLTCMSQQVQQVRSSWCSFAAIRTDGSVVTWGDPKFGGDSSMVQAKLVRVQLLGQMSKDGFASRWFNLCAQSRKICTEVARVVNSVSEAYWSVLLGS